MGEVPPPQRVLVQLITLPPTRASEGSLYRSIEWGAERSAHVFLRRSYRDRVLLRGGEARPGALVDALDQATADPAVLAVDLAIHPHGTSRRLLLEDGPVSMEALVTRVRDRLDAARRRRLRAVFSTACFGMAHADGWLRAGFATAVGARGIYADGLTSVPSMFRGWARGRTVEQCVESANAGRLCRRQDAAAARYYDRSGRHGDAMAVDSLRIVDGARAMRIDTDPAQWRPVRLPA